MPWEGIAGSVRKPLGSDVESKTTARAQAYLKEFAIDCYGPLYKRGISSSKLVWLRSILVHSFRVLYRSKEVLAVGSCLNNHIAVFEDVEIH
jgi:hypothetical protein